jgi:hypothetical protein
MNDIASTITALGTLVAAIGAVILAWRNSQKADEAKVKATLAAEAAAAAQREVIATKDGVFEVGRQIDGRLTQLMASATALARAEGVAQGEQRQRDRQSPAEGGSPTQPVHEVTIVNQPGDPVPVVSIEGKP